MQLTFLSPSPFFKSPDWSIMWQCTPPPLRGVLLFYSLIWPIRGCATGQGMVFYLSVLNRVYIFVRWRICPSYKQDIACTIDCLYWKCITELRGTLVRPGIRSMKFPPPPLLIPMAPIWHFLQSVWICLEEKSTLSLAIVGPDFNLKS